MALVKHETGRRETSLRTPDLFDRLFEDRLNFLRHPMLVWPSSAEGVAVEEFQEDGTLVVRVELAGIDPEKDVEISVSNQMLHIAAERHEETKSEDRDYVRREFRYGAFERDLPLPAGVSDEDVKATYKDGILEVRVPLPSAKPSVKVPVAKG